MGASATPWHDLLPRLPLFLLQKMRFSATLADRRSLPSAFSFQKMRLSAAPYSALPSPFFSLSGFPPTPLLALMLPVAKVPPSKDVLDAFPSCHFLP